MVTGRFRHPSDPAAGLTDLYLQKPSHPPDDERYYTERRCG